MDVRSRLIPVRAPRAPDAVVLVLHGGGSSTAGVAVSPTQLSVLRMVPIARRIARAGRGRLAVFRVLNSARGWDAAHTPVDDVRWALGLVRERFGPDLAVGLVGHSLGARAAVLAAAEPGVRTVVALAPFVYPQDGDVDAAGRELLFLHGTDDRIADLQRSRSTARHLARRANVEFVSVAGGKHAMLRRHDEFSLRTADFCVRSLLQGVSSSDPDAVDGSGTERFVEV